MRNFLLALGLAFLIAPAAQAANPIGHYEHTSSDCRIYGWAVDMDAPKSSIYVQIHGDATGGNGGLFLGRARADQYRPDVNSVLGISGYHGWSFKLPRLTFGTYVYVEGVNVGPGGTRNLSGSPQFVRSCP